MATAPVKKDNVASTTNLMNLARAEGSAEFRAATRDVVEGNTETLRTMGGVILGNKGFRNEFLSWLINRIAMVLVTSKVYYNPWQIFKRGILDYGETIEEIFVEICNPHKYNPEVAEKEVEKREIPNVKAVFHTLNYEYFYKQTIEYKDLHKAFLSFTGVSDLVSKIIQAMYTSANYDEFLVSKYMLGRAMLAGDFTPVDVGDTSTKDGLLASTTVIKGISNSLEFMSSDYNPMGVHTYSDKTDQILIMNAKFDASMDVNVLASAFNMDKAQFLGQRVLIDSFGSLDQNRLAKLFEMNPDYVPLTSEELEALDAIPAVLVDRSWFMIFDNLLEMDERHNGEGLYWNYWLHTWKTFSYSPFANAIAFTKGESTVTAVTIEPTAVTVKAGGSTQLKATVEGTNFVATSVTWASDNEKVEVTSGGTVYVKKDATDTATITATSTFDPTKSATCTITIG